MDEQRGLTPASFSNVPGVVETSAMLPWHRAVSAWCDQLTAGTKRNYRSTLEHFFETPGMVQMMEEVRAQHLREWRGALVQNILVMRFGNRIFEPLWSAEHVDNVQITVAENIGMEGARGGYYDHTGALKDMIQNHLMQLMTLMAMDKPLSLQANDVRQRKIDVLRQIRPMTPAEVKINTVRAQYDAGSINYRPVQGYRQETNVAPASQTETYVALKLVVENERWAGVPFYLRTGKRLPERISEIAIKFKRPRFPLFKDFGEDALPANTLLLRIQPAEGISLRFDVKLPGPQMQLRAMNMDFAYGKFDVFTPEAYERLLYDAMHGDGTLFTRREETELAWGITEAIAAGWAEQGPNGLARYAAGTWGPRAAAELLRRDKRTWRRL